MPTRYSYFASTRLHSYLIFIFISLDFHIFKHNHVILTTYSHIVISYDQHYLSYYLFFFWKHLTKACLFMIFNYLLTHFYLLLTFNVIWFVFTGVYNDFFLVYYSLDKDIFTYRNVVHSFIYILQVIKLYKLLNSDFLDSLFLLCFFHFNT